jgi:hypothetical protein
LSFGPPGGELTLAQEVTNKARSIFVIFVFKLIFDFNESFT